MATKRIETQLTIRAVDHYTTRVKAMEKTTGRFADRVRAEAKSMQGLRGPIKLIEDFRSVQGELTKSRSDLEAARLKVRSLSRDMAAASKPSHDLKQSYSEARREVGRLERAIDKNEKALSGARTTMRGAGIDTANLAGEHRRFAKDLDAMAPSFARHVERLGNVERMQGRLASGRRQMDRSLATAANLSFVGHASTNVGRAAFRGISNPVRAAMDFETGMSDVKKVVDFDSPIAFRQMSDDILRLSTQMPETAEGLTAIVAAGGQSGIARKDLLEFAELAAKVGVAFDISADQSGEAMAKIKTALNLSMRDTALSFDAINHLSNNMASSAPDVLDFSRRVAVDGAVKGYSATDTMAFGSAMVAAGAQPDVAATSFRNMGKALTRADGTTKRQDAAFAQLGLDSGDVALRMQEDAAAMTIEVMRRINEVIPKHLQASVISDLFGDEARALAPLISNLDLLRDALGLVSDEREFQGSAQREYEARAATTSNNLQLTRNHLTSLGITMGEIVLPPFNDFLETSQGIIEKFTEWTKEHPKLTKAILFGTTALVGMAVVGGVLLTAAAGLIGTLAVLRFGLIGFGARAAFAATDLLGMGRSIDGLNRRRFRLGRPNFKPHLSDFKTFGNQAMGEIGDLERRHNRALDRMARRRRNARFAALAGAGKFLLKGGAVGAGAAIGLGIKPVAPAEARPDAKAPTQPEINQMHAQDQRFQQSVSTLEGFTAQDALPTRDRIAHLSSEVEVFRQEVEAARASLEGMQNFGGILDPRRVTAQADLDAALSGLRKAEEELSSAEKEATHLRDALRVLDSTSAEPEISASSIDRALAKVKELSSHINAFPDAEVSLSGGPTSAPASPISPAPLRPVGARAFGGPAHAGLPYQINEYTPRSEIFVPSQSGGVLNVSQAQAVYRSHLAARFPAGQRSAPSVRSGARLLASSAAVAPGSTGGVGGNRVVSINVGDIVIPVPPGAPNPGQFAEAAADHLSKRLAGVLRARFSE